jgi:hypothetical protein
MKNEIYRHNNEFIVNFFVDCGTVSRTEDAAGAGDWWVGDWHDAVIYR